MNYRQEIQKLFRHEKIDFIPLVHNFNYIPADQIEHGVGMHKFGDTAVDMFGVHWTMTDLGATPTPNVYRAETIEECIEAVPSDETVDAQDWQGWVDKFTINLKRDEAEEVFLTDTWNPKNMTEVFIPAGMFERMHHLLGMENAMITLVTEPEGVHAFIKEMVRYKKAIFRNVKKYTNADIIFCMDDYGTSVSMMMSREMWLNYYSKPLTELISYAHKLGMFYEVHSCGYITPIFGDIVAAGADAINPVQDMNDIDYIAKTYGGQILIDGGTNGQMLACTEKDEALVENIRTCVRKLGPTGCFLPEWTIQGATKERVDRIREIYVQELAAIGIACK